MTTRPPFRHVLVATDFGESATRAIDAAVDFAARFAARLTVLHVVEDVITSYAPEGPGAFAPSSFPELEHAAQHELDRVLARIKDRAPLVEGVLRRGDPATEILAHADETACDLIVVGTHGRRGVARWLLGSVAEKIVRASPIAVLTIRERSVRAAA